ERWTITPVGGSGKVPTFVALLAPQKGLNIATLLDIDTESRPAIEALFKKKLLVKKQVLTYAEFTGGKEADVEDMFERDFYLKLVNAEFAKALQTPLTAAGLNSKVPRVLRAIEEALKATPLKSGEFGHYRPARYFSENLATLKVSDATKARFADA